MQLYEDESRTSAEVKEIAAHHLGEIDRKIADLQGMRAMLSHLVEACAGDQRPDCPILQSLGDAGDLD